MLMVIALLAGCHITIYRPAGIGLFTLHSILDLLILLNNKDFYNGAFTP